MIATGIKVGLVLAVAQPAYEVRVGAELVREVRVDDMSVMVRFRESVIDGFAKCHADARNLFDVPFDPERAPRYVATASTWVSNDPEHGVFLGGAVVKSFDARLAASRGQTLDECGKDCVAMPARLEVTCE